MTNEPAHGETGSADPRSVPRPVESDLESHANAPVPTPPPTKSSSPNLPPPSPSSPSSPPSPPPPGESWPHASWRGWKLWIQGDPLWRITVVALLLLNLSFIPWPFTRHGLWHESAWDTHIFANTPAVDFFSIYEAGCRARAGLDPYGINLPNERTPIGAPYFASYRYLPITTYWLAVPLSLIPPWWAYAFWIAFNEALLFFNLGLTSAFAPSAIRRPLGALWLVFFPLHIEYHLGQFSFFMGSLIFYAGLALWRGRTARAVTWWGISGALKNWTFIFCPFWLVRRNRATWTSFAWVLLVGGTTIGYFAAYPQWFKAFYKDAGKGRWAAGTDDLYWGRQGTQMMIASLFAGGRMPEERNLKDKNQQWVNEAASAVNAALSLLTLALVVWACAWRGRNAHALDLLALAWMWWFFAYLDTWEHHYVMLLPMLALLGMARRLSGWRLWVPAILWAAPSLWVAAGQSVAAHDPASPFWVLAYFWQRPIAVVYLFGFLVWRVIRSTSRETTK